MASHATQGDIFIYNSLHGPHTFYSECGLLTWRRLEMQNARPHSRATDPNPHFNNIPREFACTLKPEKGYLITNSNFIYQSPSVSLHSSHTGLLEFLEHSTHDSTPGPLHLLYLLPAVNLPWIPNWLSCLNSFRTLLQYYLIDEAFLISNLNTSIFPQESMSYLLYFLFFQNPYYPPGIPYLCLFTCSLSLFHYTPVNSTNVRGFVLFFALSLLPRIVPNPWYWVGQNVHFYFSVRWL